MLKFILEIILILAFGVILYLLARALPRVDDTEENTAKAPELHWFTPILEQIDERLKRFLERFFRRLKVVILKLDNFVSTQLNKFRKEETKEIKLPVSTESSGSLEAAEKEKPLEENP